MPKAVVRFLIWSSFIGGKQKFKFLLWLSIDQIVVCIEWQYFPKRLRETAKSILAHTNSSFFLFSIHSIASLNSSNRQIYLVKSQYSVLAFQRHVELAWILRYSHNSWRKQSSAYGLVGIFR
jgi:hypothetical protein